MILRWVCDKGERDRPGTLVSRSVWWGRSYLVSKVSSPLLLSQSANTRLQQDFNLMLTVFRIMSTVFPHLHWRLSHFCIYSDLSY